MLLERPDSFRLNPFHPLANGLVFAGLGNMAGTTHYHDSSLYGNHGVVQNYATGTWSRAIARAAVQLNGSNQWANIPDNVSNVSGFGSVWSCAAWCRLEEDASADSGVFGDPQIWLDVQAGPVWRIGIQGPDVLYSDTSADISGTWVHIGVTYDAAKYSWYLNGHADGTDAAAANSFTFDTIGAINDGASKFFDGAIADPMIWCTVLCESQFAQLADPSNVMLSGLILPPRRKLWPVTSGAAASIIPRIMHHRKMIGVS